MSNVPEAFSCIFFFGKKLIRIFIISFLVFSVHYWFIGPWRGTGYDMKDMKVGNRIGFTQKIEVSLSD